MENAGDASILQTVTVCISAIVAVISLVLSLLGHLRQKPRLKIVIPDPEQGCFYGWRESGEGNQYMRVAYVHVCLVNNSPVAIGAEDVIMSVKGKRLPRVLPDNDFWDDTTIFYRAEEKLVDHGMSLHYSADALRFPRKVDAYDTASGIVLFHYMPSSIKGDCTAEIVMSTAIGKVKKRIRLREYNEKVMDHLLRDFADYNDSIERFSA